MWGNMYRIIHHIDERGVEERQTWNKIVHMTVRTLTRARASQTRDAYDF